jgi:hypothetical protein
MIKEKEKSQGPTQFVVCFLPSAQGVVFNISSAIIII